MKFSHFILNENQVYFGQKIGDILNSLHDLGETGQHMGTRLLMFQAEGIVQQIRSILHTHWEKSEIKYLPVLQKVGVAIMKSIDGKNKEKTDLLAVLQGATAEIEKLSADLGTPVNALAAPATSPEKEDTGVQPPTKDIEPPKQQPQVPDNGQQPPNQQANPPEQPSSQVQGI